MEAMVQEMIFEEMSGDINETKLENLLETNESLENFNMLVLTNDAKFNGANALLMGDLLERIHERTGEDFIILPSSIHEVIIIPDPDNLRMGLDEMAEMVTEINNNEVEPEERLSNKVYRYDSQRKEVVDAYKYEQRKVLDSIDEKTIILPPSITYFSAVSIAFEFPAVKKTVSYFLGRLII